MSEFWLYFMLVAALLLQTVSVIVSGNTEEAGGIGAGMLTWVVIFATLLWRSFS